MKMMCLFVSYLLDRLKTEGAKPLTVIFNLAARLRRDWEMNTIYSVKIAGTVLLNTHDTLVFTVPFLQYLQLNNRAILS